MRGGVYRGIDNGIKVPTPNQGLLSDPPNLLPQPTQKGYLMGIRSVDIHYSTEDIVNIAYKYDESSTRVYVE